MDAAIPRKMSRYRPGKNPRSQRNLQPREALYEEAKKRREVLCTQQGWDGFKRLAKGMGLSASELVERIGRGLVEPSKLSGDREVLFIIQDGQGDRYACKRAADK